MNRIVALLLLVAAALGAAAQPPISEENRARFRQEVRQYKHDFLARELDLTREQQREFFPVYDEMEDKIDAIGSDTRALERTTAEKADATDLELEAAARATFSQKQAEGEVETAYFERFRTMLQPRQLLGLKAAERRFAQQLMRHHRRTTPKN